MTSDILTLAMIGAMIVIAGVVVWFCARRWWHYLIIAVATVMGFIPTSKYLTGDISRYLPAVIFADGKDNFIWISIFATFLVPLVAASVMILLADRTWFGVRSGRGGEALDN
jgi:uncharacterized membrane protein